jgi:hypothetical protein
MIVHFPITSRLYRCIKSSLWRFIVAEHCKRSNYGVVATALLDWCFHSQVENSACLVTIWDALPVLRDCDTQLALFIRSYRYKHTYLDTMSVDGSQHQQRKREIYTYSLPWSGYALAWSRRCVRFVLAFFWWRMHVCQHHL